MNTDETRVAFEKWCWPEELTAEMLRDGESYIKPFNMCWTVWQAATAAAEEKYQELVGACLENKSIIENLGYRTSVIDGVSAQDRFLKALAPLLGEK